MQGDNKRSWRTASPEISKTRNTEARKKFYKESKQKVLDWNKEYREKNYDKHLSNTRSARKKRREHDMAYVIKDRLRARFSSALRHKKKGKLSDTMRLVGCNIDSLIEHIGGLSKDNEIDHIFPFELYNLGDLQQQQRVMNFGNFQSLTVEENKDKSDKLPTKAMAAKVPVHLWPPGVTEEMLPDIYDGWETPTVCFQNSLDRRPRRHSVRDVAG